jgi:hypothetical protein
LTHEKIIAYAASRFTNEPEQKFKGKLYGISLTLLARPDYGVDMLQCVNAFTKRNNHQV